MRLSIALPDRLDHNLKGKFFEDFVSDLVRPMRLKVTQRVAFTGMEIDVLANDQDQPRTYLIECKAQADPLGGEVIQKLLGARQVRKAEVAWLFATSELTKGAKGLVEEISADPDLARTFAWFPAERICELLIEQTRVRDPKTLQPHVEGMSLGEWTLVVGPGRWLWLAELVAKGLPLALAAFEAETGDPLDRLDFSELGVLAERYETLSLVRPSAPVGPQPVPTEHPPVARVVSGDTWADPRPSRPIDFVGRDDLIRDIGVFLDSVRLGNTETRSFALQARSGWGKSSLTLKLADLARRGQGIRNCSVTAIDSRSATTSAFVTEAVRLAFRDAASRGLIADSEYDLSSVLHPLRSDSLAEAYRSLANAKAVIVLVFDQFEELFAKESLFEAFNAVRELALDLDSMQVPFVLGFAWKTDIALPQQHPAYHLWHELSDRRRTFQVPEFGVKESRRVITKAEKALDKTLSPALRARLVEQSQGLPWLLKKLLVHVLQLVTTAESQYLLLERELDVEMLFKEDLSALSENAVKCLRFIAATAPVPVSDVEADFDHGTTNELLSARLIVRSGMNYVIYWDIFRDYLVDGKVPQIPWGRTFQSEPSSGVRALRTLYRDGPLTASELASSLGFKEGTTFNQLGDLVALQLVDRTTGDRYCVGGVVDATDRMAIAQHARGQLSRHVVMKAIQENWSRDDRLTADEWESFFSQTQPGAAELAPKTVRQYAGTLRRWLLFAGLLERTSRHLHLPDGSGEQMGSLTSARASGVFLGTTAPERVVELLGLLQKAGGHVSRDELLPLGLRNAISDSAALGLVSTIAEPRYISIAPRWAKTDPRDALAATLERDSVFQVVVQACGSPEGRVLIGDDLEWLVGASWRPSSKRRHANGLTRYVQWHHEYTQYARLQHNPSQD